jgi:hypothetical protein
MSNPFKAIGKVFKKVVKVVKKIALPALMIGAVVLTGGAALGALPALGTILGSVGISGTLASVLGGAISMGAVGAVTGGLMGAVTGQGFMKGATTGFLGGALTGGIGGGIGLIGANGIFGGAAAAGASGHALGGAGATAMTTGAGGMSGAAGAIGAGGMAGANVAGQVGVGMLNGSIPTAVSSSLAAAAPAATAASGGLLGTLAPQLLQVGGQMISGFAAGKAAEAQAEAEAEEDKANYDRIAFNYGYKNIYKGKNDLVPSSQERFYEYAPLDHNIPTGLLYNGLTPAAQPSAGRYQIVNGEVVFVGGQ